MKLLLSVVLILAASTSALALEKISPSSLSQAPNGAWTYERVVNVENTSQKELYTRVKQWILGNIKTADNNIYYDDTAFETIITTPSLAIENLKYNWIVGQQMNFKLQVAFKDNKFRIQANSFYYSGNNGLIGGPIETFETGRSFTKDLNPKFDKAFLAFVESFIAAASSARKNDW